MKSNIGATDSFRINMQLGYAANTPANPAPVPPARSSPFFDVCDYGAKGDGIADDTAALQKALDSVGTPELKRSAIWVPGT